MPGFRSLAAATLLAAMPVVAQDTTARVDAIFDFATRETPGCSVGVSVKGRAVVNKAYGLANVETRVPLGPNSLFDIGSTQKQFTAASILLLARDGRLSLADDVRKHLPELPDYGHTVTVDNLLTHTGGIRDWTGLLPMAPEGTDVATLLLRQRGLNFVPGTDWRYSNGGYELAKTIVARVSGMPFAEFTRTRIFGPLGMKASAYVPDILQAGTSAAMGYRKDGTGWKPYMRVGNNRGGGAIVSTVGDMLLWQDAMASGKLGTFVTDKLHEQTRLRNGRTLSYARGVIVASTPFGVVISHSGEAAGFSTWMGRVPEHGLSVAVSCNFDPVSASALARRVGEVFLPPVDPRAEARARDEAPVALPGVELGGREGLFFDERSGEPMRLELVDGRLAIANGPPLVPVSLSSFRPPRPTPFFRSEDDFVLTFVDADHVEIRSMEGDVTRYRRARPHTPDSADLQALEGRYESPELGSVFEIVPGTRGLTMRMEGAPGRSVPLAAVERDTYMLRMMIVRFRRDASGKVMGFTYDNPVARGIHFTRLAERKSDRPPPANVPADESAAGTPAAARGTPRLESLVGNYEMAPGGTITITLENGQLHGQPAHNPKRPLVHLTGATFGVGSAESATTVTFILAADGRATAMVMKQNGRERTLTRAR